MAGPENNGLTTEEMDALRNRFSLSDNQPLIQDPQETSEIVGAIEPDKLAQMHQEARRAPFASLDFTDRVADEMLSIQDRVDAHSIGGPMDGIGDIHHSQEPSAAARVLFSRIDHHLNQHDPSEPNSQTNS